jgi:hypothetical protein
VRRADYARCVNSQACGSGWTPWVKSTPRPPSTRATG